MDRVRPHPIASSRLPSISSSGVFAIIIRHQEAGVGLHHFLTGKASVAMVEQKWLEQWQAITDALIQDLAPLRFAAPVAHVYNPLVYARVPHDRYLERYGRPAKQVVFVGMNPGPWGMAQTGVPFGEVAAVRDFLGIQGPVHTPPGLHPKRPVQGFACPRSEVSGQRLWGWIAKRFGRPAAFFDRFFVANYCPLMFVEASARNLTPDKLPAAAKAALLAACDQALRRTVALLRPRWVVGIGRFAADRCALSLADCDVTIGQITHPSPANPKANRGWEPLVEAELRALGIKAGP